MKHKVSSMKEERGSLKTEKAQKRSLMIRAQDLLK
jgi:hypothetical protein